MGRLLVSVALGLLLTVALALPAEAADSVNPGSKTPVYKRWSYPAQIPNGPIETGNLPGASQSGGFLTLPFLEPHFVTSLFDHCNPNYVRDGLVCRFDGAAAGIGSGTDPRDNGGHPVTTGGKDYLYYDGHDGFDYSLFNQPVVAAADGVVTYADWQRPGCWACGYGQQVLIDHGNGFITRYGHLSRIGVGAGQRVRRGQVLGISGTTGSSSGEHLHFGVYRSAGMIPVDPYGWSGSGRDPWDHDAGDLWLGGAPRYPQISIPSVSVAVAYDAGAIRVSWSSPSGGRFEVRAVEDEQPSRDWLAGQAAGSALFQGEAGHYYWFLVTVTTDLGLTAMGMSDTLMAGAEGPGG
jgi:murein DD-endopeptidase MepM/ murein hydrolase activator NlpD